MYVCHFLVHLKKFWVSPKRFDYYFGHTEGPGISRIYEKDEGGHDCHISN